MAIRIGVIIRQLFKTGPYLLRGYGLVFLCFCMSCHEQGMEPNGKIVAHRGAWKTNGHPQNSIASLKQAIAEGYAGSEFDVNMTMDDSLVITHGPRYQKMDIEKSSFGELVSRPLKNGEKLPTLGEYLLAGTANNDSTQLFCEIKPSRISKERTLQMTAEIVALVKDFDAVKYMVFISFDYDALKKILELLPDANVQYLGGDRSPEALGNDGINGVNYRYGKLKKHPEYIGSAKQHGITLNSGTVNDSLDMDWLLVNELDYIATNYPELLRERIKKSPITKDWKLVWSDEFHSNGKPDSTKWNHENGLIRNREAQLYTDSPKNSRKENGYLIIEGHKEQLRNPRFVDTESKIWKEKQEFIEYSSASLTTHGLASWTYGKIEVRAKLPRGIGLWPAIWMLGDNIKEKGWPQCGEIDIMEHVGFDPETIFGTVHTKAYNHAKGTQVGKKIGIGDPYDSFHTYGIEWDENKIDFLLDGKVYHQFRNENKTEAEWPFDKPFHLKLNLAIGGMLGGRKGIDDTVFPQQFLIDYVRVFQKEQY